MLKLLDVLVQLDHLKNAKASIPNDFSWYKRYAFTFYLCHFVFYSSFGLGLSLLVISHTHSFLKLFFMHGAYRNLYFDNVRQGSDISVFFIFVNIVAYQLPQFFNVTHVEFL